MLSPTFGAVPRRDHYDVMKPDMESNAFQGQRDGAPAHGRPPVDPSQAARRDQFETEALVHLDALFGLALELTRCGTEAEDIVADTIARAFEQWERYRLGTNIRGWLFTLLHQTIARRTPAADLTEPTWAPDNADGWSSAGIPDGTTLGWADAEGHFYDALPREAVVRAIASLPRRYGAAVILSDLRGLRYAEVGEVLGVPEAVAKARLFHGRRLLQRTLVGYAAEAGRSAAARAPYGAP